MWLAKATHVLEKGLSPLVNVIGRIGTAFIAIIMLLTVVDVIGRRAFSSPISGSIEISQLMLVIAVFGTMAVCELTRGHVTIELVVSRLRRRPQAIIDSLMYLFFLVILSLITWQLFNRAINEIGGMETGVLSIPIYPVLFIAGFFSLLLSLVVLMNLLLFLLGAIKK